MGEMAQQISNVDRKELINILNVAFAEEWLAYYQYWMGAQVAVGPMRKDIAAEFMEHAHEELDHAQKLVTRIIELGGTPLLDPDDWKKTAQCKYEAPSDDYVEKLLKQNLVAERCAIARYQKICEMTVGKDFATFHMSRHILYEEIEHEQEIGDYLNDIEAGREHMHNMQK
ncbi:MAG: ferritin-like domain-containing protein [Alphaproteobacteria bacterium]|nr:ferritin-like domain-containing protein [Alphaproteobacteria bacterium]